MITQPQITKANLSTPACTTPRITTPTTNMGILSKIYRSMIFSTRPAEICLRTAINCTSVTQISAITDAVAAPAAAYARIKKKLSITFTAEPVNTEIVRNFS